jgi:putative thioredoxin
VEAFFDSLVPSRVDELLAAGDELSLREAAELDPRRADVAVALGRARLARGADDEALAAVEGHPEDFAAQGIAARVGLSRAGIGDDAFAALDRGEREAALDGLLDELGRVGEANGEAPEDARDLLRQAFVGILNEGDQADPSARDYRRKLASALG